MTTNNPKKQYGFVHAEPAHSGPPRQSHMRSLFRIVMALVIAATTWSATFSKAAKVPVPQSEEFDKAVEVIKKYEGLHKNKGNLVGYGHKILPGDPYKRNQTLTLEEADKLLRQDLAALCQRYRSFGKDSLILSALAYNCGIGVVANSPVLKKLKAGDREIEAAYISHSKYRGKTLSQLKKRRTEELEVLFIK